MGDFLLFAKRCLRTRDLSRSPRAGGPKLLRGVPRWRDRFVQYGIKVSFWGSGTLKVVIYGLRVEGYNLSKLGNGEDITVAHGLWKSNAHTLWR